VKATQFEFRYRLWIGLVIYVIGFWSPWLRYGKLAAPVTTTWLELTFQLGRIMPLSAASLTITIAAILLLAAGAGMRIWGSAYLGPSIVTSGSMHAHTVLAAGPYRYFRNPLYSGSYLNQLAVAILMPPSGSVFFVVACSVQIIRLILGEEAYLAKQQGAPYLEYKARVPRLLPALTPRVPASPVVPKWGIATVSETFYVACTISFLALAWRYNAFLLMQAIVVCFGLSLVVRALFVKKAA
jgi:protein-S-isoprenylcysteine O-methyltransferase Ste14